MNIDLINEQYDPPPHKKARSGCSSGCLIAVVIVVVLIGAGTIYIVSNFKTIAARVVTMVVRKTIEGSDLPAEQKQKLVARIDKLRDDFIDGKVSDEQLKRIVDEIIKSPLMPVGMVLFIESEHIAKSGLTDEEKKAAKVTLNRLARGVHENKIPRDKLDALFRIISDTDEDGDRELKKKMTDAELREFLKLAEQEADKAKVPAEPLQIDLAKELDAAIERAMKEPPAEQEPPAGKDLPAEKPF